MSSEQKPNPSSPPTCCDSTRRRGPGFLPYSPSKPARARTGLLAVDACGEREQCRSRWRAAPGSAAGCRPRRRQHQQRRAAARLRLGGAATAGRRQFTWRTRRRATGRCRARSEAPSTPWTRSRTPCPAGQYPQSAAKVAPSSGGSAEILVRLLYFGDPFNVSSFPVSFVDHRTVANLLKSSFASRFWRFI